jgi:hypothetical protein
VVDTVVARVLDHLGVAHRSADAGGGTGVILRQLFTWGAFVKFSHTIFALALCPGVHGGGGAGPRGWPGWRVSVILLAMVSARTCAMTFNRIVDRQFDRLNPRTANRHLPAGQISLASAWTLWASEPPGLVVAAVSSSTRLCFWLSPVALAVICFYSWTKRFYRLHASVPRPGPGHRTHRRLAGGQRNRRWWPMRESFGCCP